MLTVAVQNIQAKFKERCFAQTDSILQTLYLLYKMVFWGMNESMHVAMSDDDRGEPRSLVSAGGLCFNSQREREREAEAFLLFFVIWRMLQLTRVRRAGVILQTARCLLCHLGAIIDQARKIPKRLHYSIVQQFPLLDSCTVRLTPLDSPEMS